MARRIVEENYAGRLERHKLDDVKLIASELVDNAYVHGQGRIGLKLQLGERQLRVEVTDEGQNASIEIRRAGARNGGHGLRLVDLLCSDWGAYEDSTHVWADLPLDT